MWHREYRRWRSPALGRDMELLVLGHGGARALVFPTSQGRFYEWEDRGMADALGEHLSRGWLQLYCVDSVDAESWYATWKHPRDRAVRHHQYEQYLLKEVLPLSEHLNPSPFLIATGASFGAYHALNIALRHPWRFGRVLAMAGLFDIKRFTGGYADDVVYHNSPSDYLSGDLDPNRLEAIRRLDIILALGADDPNRGNNDHLSHVLWTLGVWHAYRLWDGWAHDWPWWRQMVLKYIGGSD